ncbi:AmmeMemoRadiSam system radical SAM enzyme [Prolixibacteraceae bacterium Z1-6]|uniref:AmmeMemoRadiSam system radical SAM enzyme n=1 Tax=Draconibacterium aestuarii TaxID=2998507 RepID=A0A9X3J841_9BACT|nr:AmmeMemoRadiSam system radical SAM enzyme [Prolixibacteraceae bacterium Z1-6]
MKEALFYTKLKENRVKCELCPWNCILNIDQTGNCKVRTNQNGRLITEVYNKVAALGSDPIEKKPLYHFYPGTSILSIGEVGCNLHCSFCQNHRISQCEAKQFSGFHNIASDQIITEALKTWNNIGIAYTYNEPFTFYEFMLETAEKAKAANLKNVVVSNGYINTEPLQHLIPFIDAFNIDLKAFSEEFYQKHTKGKLQPVLETLKTIAQSQTHLEITNLVIPGLNDNKPEFENMVKWVASELGEKTPLHLSRYYPQFKMTISPTPIETLTSFYNIAKQHLQHVYLGNVSDVERSSTFCSSCGEVLVTRNRYNTELNRLTTNGNCTNCGTPSNIKL